MTALAQSGIADGLATAAIKKTGRERTGAC